MDIITLMFLKAMSASEPETEEATASGNPATFTTDIVKPLSALSVTFAPIQEGSGDPTEQNIRNISGKSSIKVSVSGGEDYTTSLENTYFGGTLNVLTGVLTVNWQMKSNKWGDIRDQGPNSTTGYWRGVMEFPYGPERVVEGYGTDTICNCINAVIWDSAGRTPQHYYIPGASTNNKAYIFGDFDVDTVVQIAVKLASPFTVQLTGQQVKDVLGANSISADTNGTITLTYLKIKSEGD